MTIQEQDQLQLTGLLAGLIPGQLQTWGQLAMLPLFPASMQPDNARFVSPLEHLKLVRVQTYGTLILENTNSQGLLIAPMHIGFFQAGAQNHSTSRVIVLGEGETLTVEDCFCIQQSQGGFLKEAQQRFIILPLNLRSEALALRSQEGFSRLWGSIEQFNRRHGIKRGGHLERFLRPNFARLLLFRHALETLPEQVGAAFFIANRLVGIEVAPNAAYWQDIAPILTIYCYGSAALLADQLQMGVVHQPVQLDALNTVADLKQRLVETRAQDQALHFEALRECIEAPWNSLPEAESQGLNIATLSQDTWSGQSVKDGETLLYLSTFRSLI
jgi:hypothetical protein